MPQISTRQGLKEYCLRALGHPVIRINVDDAQLEDRIDDALNLFSSFHMYGSTREFLRHTITQENIDNSEIDLPGPVTGVLNFYPDAAGLLGYGNISNLQYMSFVSDLMTTRNRSGCHPLMDYAIRSSYINTIKQTLSGGSWFEYKQTTGKMKILSTLNLKVGDIALIECYVAIDPAEYHKVWDEYWLKEYVTALFQEQWGNNISKYTNQTLPGGAQLDSSRILSEAQQKKERLEELLKSTYQEPVDFFMG